MQSCRDVDLYYHCADVLLKLVQQRGFEMFVHPIAPVLNETRHVVAPFNHKLKQQVILLAPCGELLQTLFSAAAAAAPA